MTDDIEEGFDSGDPESVGRAKQKNKSRQQTEDNDLLELMKLPVGRRFIWKQLSEGGIFRLSYNQSALKMALNEGRRAGALNLFLDCHRVCPDLYTVMARECSTES
jgi:hypothetical protein